jgi:acetoin utilization protein AcuB
MWMTARPITIEADASALAALDAMVDHGIRHLPVVWGRRVVGVLSFHDLRAALPVAIDLRRGIDVDDFEAVRGYAVAEMMTCFPEVVRPEASLAEAAGRLAARRIGCLPVVDPSNALIGILTSTDALRALSLGPSAHRREAATAHAEDVADLVAELGAERQRISRELDRASRVERELAARAGESGGMDLEERSADRDALRLEVALHDHATRRLHAIEHALDRAAARALTICELCAGEIALARLRALPGATTCVACARARAA